MDTRIVIGIVGLFVVLFFGYQWWATSSRRRVVAAPSKAVVEMLSQNGGTDPAPTMPPQVAASTSIATPQAEALPDMPGRTPAEVMAKEPVQQRRIGGTQEPAMYDGAGPAQFGDNLRHPENLFHQPQAVEAMPPSDVASGRAAVQSTPLAVHQQPFSPELAQNGGALIGNSMFAYDGMEPTTFSAF